MKILIKEFSWSLKPKQVEGKIVPKRVEFTVKPKPSGVILQKYVMSSVCKQDARCGVSIQKISDNKILKQND
jgi:hypothetical protein